MATIKELKEQRAKIVDRSKGRIDNAEKEGRDFNEEESKQHNTDREEIEKLNNRIQRQEEAGGWQLDKPEDGSSDNPNPSMGAPRQDPDQKSYVRVEPSYNRYGRLQNFPATKEGYEQAVISGLWAMATIYGNRSAEKRLKERYGITIEMAQTEGTNTAGGYLVIPEFERAILDVRNRHGKFAQYAEPVAMGSNQRSQPKHAGVLTHYWVGEGVAPTESQAAWSNVVLDAKTVGAWARISSDLDDDSWVSVIDNLAFELGMAFSYAEDLAGFLGDGSATYGHHTGVITKVNDGNHTSSVYTAASGNTAFSTLDLTDFESMVGQAPEWVIEGGQAAWYISQPGYWASMARLMDAAGGNTKMDLGNGPELVFLGFPVRLVNVMNSTLTAQTSTNGLCLFGDLRRAAKFGRRSGVAVDVARELYIANRQIGVFGHERVAINVHTLDTVEADGTLTAGPIISLSTPGL